MTPKEKAKQLLWEYLPILEGWTDVGKSQLAKQCALIAVDEIIDAIDFDWMERQNLDRVFHYWEEVKQEIEKL